jgi:hypothetical protein
MVKKLSVPVHISDTTSRRAWQKFYLSFMKHCYPPLLSFMQMKSISKGCACHSKRSKKAMVQMEKVKQHISCTFQGEGDVHVFCLVRSVISTIHGIPSNNSW